MLYLSLEDTEWPWVALVCMQTVVLMSVGIAPRQKIYVEIAPPSLSGRVNTPNFMRNSRRGQKESKRTPL